jgi:hypothetical protein
MALQQGLYIMYMPVCMSRVEQTHSHAYMK